MNLLVQLNSSGQPRRPGRRERVAAGRPSSARQVSYLARPVCVCVCICAELAWQL